MPNGVEFFHGNYIEKEIEYFLFNTVTQETVTLCKYDDVDCIAGLQENGFYMLTPEMYGEDTYDYPAIYKSPGIVWDQSEERKTNGDWAMMSREKEPKPESEDEQISSNIEAVNKLNNDKNGISATTTNDTTVTNISSKDTQLVMIKNGDNLLSVPLTPATIQLLINQNEKEDTTDDDEDNE